MILYMKTVYLIISIHYSPFQLLTNPSHHISFPTFHLLFFNPLSPICTPDAWMSRAAPGAEESYQRSQSYMWMGRAAAGAQKPYQRPVGGKSCPWSTHSLEVNVLLVGCLVLFLNPGKPLLPCLGLQYFAFLLPLYLFWLCIVCTLCGHATTCGSRLSNSILWGLGMDLTSPGLVTGGPAPTEPFHQPPILNIFVCFLC